MTDLAQLVSRFAVRLRAEGLAVGADRTARFAAAIVLADPATGPALHDCALATLVSSPAEIAVLDRVFAAVFGGFDDPASRRRRPDRAGPGDQPGLPRAGMGPQPVPGNGSRSGENSEMSTVDRTRLPCAERTQAVATAATDLERLSTRDFVELSDEELARLAELMRRFRFVTPPRRSRRVRPSASGHADDIRESLRRARRSGGEVIRLRRTVVRVKRRRLVVLCDISGSMRRHARAMLQLLYCARGGAGAEVFTFATRLTRLTPALTADRPDRALARAGRVAPDWAGGTRIGAALADFLRHYGARGYARGAVVVIVSDGWETGPPDLLDRQLARLSRLAYRIVWVNPRAANPRYRPLVGGMAAALPYCDAMVTAHRIDAVDELVAAIADPVRRRPAARGQRTARLGMPRQRVAPGRASPFITSDSASTAVPAPTAVS